MKEDLDYRNAFGKYISSCEGYLLAMHALSAPSVAEEYAKNAKTSAFRVDV